MINLDQEIVTATDRLNSARTALMAADITVFDVETALKQAEALERVNGLDGKNVDERDANLRLKLAKEICDLTEAKTARIKAATDYDIALANVRCVRARIALEVGAIGV